MQRLTSGEEETGNSPGLLRSDSPEKDSGKVQVKPREIGEGMLSAAQLSKIYELINYVSYVLRCNRSVIATIISYKGDRIGALQGAG